VADIVAKRFCPSKRATLIRDQALLRNVDSKIHPSSFDYCAILLSGCSASTFATKSATSAKGM
jgi:hypothetical protein